MGSNIGSARAGVVGRGQSRRALLVWRRLMRVGVLVRRQSGRARLLSWPLVAGIVAYNRLNELARHRAPRARCDGARRLEEDVPRLGELGCAQADFVASIAHDPRSPLAATRAAVGLVERSAADRLSSDERDLLANTRRNVRRLGVPVDDLLALAEIETDALRPTRSPLDLREVVVDAMDELHPLLLEKDQSIEFGLSDPLPVMGDAHRSQQAVTNLLANAHRHTPSGTRISVTGWRTDYETRLAVHDEGPGIPPRFIQTDWGLGCRFAPPAKSEPPLTPADGGPWTWLEVGTASGLGR